MPQTTAKKPPRASGPTWSKVGEDKPARKAAAPKSGARAASSAPRAQNGKGRSAACSRPTPRKATPTFEIPAHLRREIVALLMLVVAALFVVGLFQWSSGKGDIVGVAGGVLAQLFGLAAWLVPVALAAGAVVLLLGARSDARWLSPTVPLGLALMLLGLMGFIHLFTSGQPAADRGQGGGYVGLAVATFLSDYLSGWGAGIVLLALALAGFMLAFGVSLAQLVRGVGGPTVVAGRFAGTALTQAREEVARLSNSSSKAQSSKSEGSLQINGEDAELGEPSALDVLSILGEEPAAAPDPHDAPTLAVDLSGKAEEPKGKEKPDAVINLRKGDKKASIGDTDAQQPIQSPLGYIWKLPPMALLETSGEQKVSQSDIKAKIKVIEETLHSFNVEATVREVNTGPAVTQFAIEPGVGVRVNRVTALDKDLALALAAPDIRIEAPIPGQSRIGIEVPNASLQVVGLRNIMESEAFSVSKGRLKIALGRDTHGNPVVTDMAKLPHILVAGATGSGKSVFLNSMVIGFLQQFTPDDLRMLMIDPKRVELTGFNGIPHLLRPVVTDVRMEKDQKSEMQNPKSDGRNRPLTAVEVLKWTLWEMERRYKLFAKGERGKDGISRVFRNIEQYRVFQRENPEVGANMEVMPYIVLIIDELADLMLTAPEEVETSLCRLAQLARATGIHLVVATQRPSVDVVTGLIKANFPARAAFAVTSQVDSKVILDSGGAEKLLGKGDMLYTASDESKPVRIQGTYVSDAESEQVVHFWRKQLPEMGSEFNVQGSTPDAQGSSPGTLNQGPGNLPSPLEMKMPDWLGTGDADAESEMLEQAIELVKKNRYVSVSMLQRKLRIGYNRAARLVEQMEELGLISSASEGNRGKPREVLLGAPDSRGDVVGGDVEEEAAG